LILFPTFPKKNLGLKILENGGNVVRSLRKPIQLDVPKVWRTVLQGRMPKVGLAEAQARLHHHAVSKLIK